MNETDFERIECVQGDLTLERVDAIVNAANQALRGGGGVDGAIHRAAGPDLLAELIELYPQGSLPGEAVLSEGHELPARHVIHTVGPVWRGGGHGEPEQLASCYRSSLRLAARHDLATVSFPAISCGVYGYPPEPAAEVAIAALGQGLAAHRGLTRARLVLLSAELAQVFQRALDRARA